MFKMLLDFCAVCQTYIIKEVLSLFPEDSYYFKMIHSCKYLIFCEKTGFLKINTRVLTAAVLMIPRTWKLLGVSFGFCLILLFETDLLYFFEYPWLLLNSEQSICLCSAGVLGQRRAPPPLGINIDGQIGCKKIRYNFLIH